MPNLTLKEASWSGILSDTPQVVVGTNYWIKVSVDHGEYLHVKIFKPPGNGQSQFHWAEGGKAYGDQLH